MLDLLLVGTILGELYVYDASKLNSNESSAASLLITKQFNQPIISIGHFDHTVFILHPYVVSFSNIDTNARTNFTQCNELTVDNNCTFQMMKINDNLNYLIVSTNNGTLTLYNLPDLTILDQVNIDSKIQVFDIYLTYLVVSTDKGINRIFDLSCKRIVELKCQESGFKFPITTDLKMFDTINDVTNLPHELKYAQTGLEGKVSIVTTKIESQTEPTVTINTAAKSAPISLSCSHTNPSGIVIPNEPEKFIFRAHRSKLNDDTMLIGPIYSLNVVGDNYLITAGYGGDSNGSIEGSISVWDVDHKKRVRFFKGFPKTIVQTESWTGANGHLLVVCACSDDSFKNMTAGSDFTPTSSMLFVVVMQ